LQLDLTLEVPAADAAEDAPAAWAWDVGARLLWSDDGRESTRVGLKVGAWPGALSRNPPPLSHELLYRGLSILRRPLIK
jgi:hypothetical protein